MSTIVEKNACFVAPVVPISRMNRVYAGDKIYLGFFKPQQSGRWIGNIKRYASRNGRYSDRRARDSEATTTDGLIKENSLSWWTRLGSDGPAVEKGGVAEVLESFHRSRDNAHHLHVYRNPAAVVRRFKCLVPSNTAITNAMLNVANRSGTPEPYSTLCAPAHFGDIIHSEPAVVVYPDPPWEPDDQRCQNRDFCRRQRRHATLHR